MLKLLMIGQRGVGKTRTLTRIHSFLKERGILVFHLDQEVEKHTGKSIRDLFEQKGEKFFRNLEIRLFSKLVEKHRDQNMVVDLGAGFQGEKPKSFKALWLQREVDLSKALFLDRPPLGDSLGISNELFQQRQKHYKAMADYRLELPEGDFGEDTSLKEFFRKSILKEEDHFFQSSWFLTVLDENHSFQLEQSRPGLQSKTRGLDETTCNGTTGKGQLTRLQNKTQGLETHSLQLEKRKDLKYELRNDLLSATTIKKLFEKDPGSLISFRKKSQCKELESFLDDQSLWDWPMEWGPNREAKILSLHQRKDSLIQTLKTLPDTDQILKLAVPIKNFTELKTAYEWFQENPKTRLFLPISEKGRWKWFRLLTAHKMPFGFLRESHALNPDQPTLMNVLCHRPQWSHFAAILGSPVTHSFTPGFHRHFFASKQMNCLAIEVFKEEWEEALGFLSSVGLKAAAVTSPLKQKAARWISENPSNPTVDMKTHTLKQKKAQWISENPSNPTVDMTTDTPKQKKAQWIGENPSAINTLFKSQKGWVGVNTDKLGFQRLISGFKDKKMVVWGGGDILDTIKEHCPQAVCYSSRTGKRKPNGTLQKVCSIKPDVLVWAVGAKNFEKRGIHPPKDWKPEIIIDLNYSLDSPARICAHNYACQYRSGLDMFIGQAEKQQEFWGRFCNEH